MTEDNTEAPQEGVTVSLPILPTHAELGKLTTPDGEVGILHTSTILSSGTWTFDRSQLLTLGAEMMKLARTMPSEKELEKAAKKIERVERGLILPS